MFLVVLLLMSPVPRVSLYGLNEFGKEAYRDSRDFDVFDDELDSYYVDDIRDSSSRDMFGARIKPRTSTASIVSDSNDSDPRDRDSSVINSNSSDPNIITKLMVKRQSPFELQQMELKRKSKVNCGETVFTSGPIIVHRPPPNPSRILHLQSCYVALFIRSVAPNNQSQKLSDGIFIVYEFRYEQMEDKATIKLKIQGHNTSWTPIDCRVLFAVTHQEEEQRTILNISHWPKDISWYESKELTFANTKFTSFDLPVDGITIALEYPFFPQTTTSKPRDKTWNEMLLGHITVLDYDIEEYWLLIPVTFVILAILCFVASCGIYNKRARFSFQKCCYKLRGIPMPADIYGPDGYNVYGFDEKGFDRAGYNFQGFDKNGLDRYGKARASTIKKSKPKRRWKRCCVKVKHI